MNDQIDRAGRRAHAYWLVDGLPEILMGVSFIMVALAIGLPMVLPASLSWAGSFSLPLVMAVVIIGGRKIVNRLKERITYPRTGFVAYARPSTRRRVLSAAAGLIIAAFAVWGVLWMPSGFMNYIPLIQGCFVALIFVLVGMRSGGLLRLYVLAGVSIGLSIIQMLVWGDASSGNVFFYCTLGMIVLLMGIFHLQSYLNRPESGEGE